MKTLETVAEKTFGNGEPRCQAWLKNNRQCNHATAAHAGTAAGPRADELCAKHLIPKAVR